MPMRVRAFLAGALVAIGGAGVFAVSTIDSLGSQRVALINADSGPVGNRIADALRSTGRFVIEPASSDDTYRRYAVRIVLPADLTASVESVTSSDPRRARLQVNADPRADPAGVDNAVDEVTSHIRIEGIRQTLSTVRAARELVGQASLTTRVLRAGVDDAASTSQRFRADADLMLKSLAQAKRRANEVQSQIRALNSAADILGTRLSEASEALDKTGVTVGQLVDGAFQVSAGLGHVIPALRALPFAHDPAVSPIITKLEALQEIAGQTDGQLYGLAELAGIPVNSNTRVSKLVSDGVARLSSARDELNASVDFARDIPQLADDGAAQLIAAQRQLDDGLGKMHGVLGNLDRLTTKALDALPEPGRETQAIAAFIEYPVDIDQVKS